MQENDFDKMFNNLKGHWDTEEPALGHQERFLKKMENKRNTKRPLYYRLALPVAAAAVIVLGTLLYFETTPGKVQQEQVVRLSPKVEETQKYFTAIIQKELAKVESENSPETKVLVRDALAQIDTLEKDYEKLTVELANKGESKKIIHAMITNFQTRISFLEEVLEKIENIKKIKEKYNEDKTI